MIARLTVIYVAIFAAVLAAISWVAYAMIAGQYQSLLAPALGTPEGQTGYVSAMRHVALAIGGVDVPLLIVVGIIAYFLARWSLHPLVAAREREKQFAADAAHEMRSPLATIASVAQAARLQADEATREALETIARTALDASGLIGDLLTLSRDPRPALLQHEPLDLAHVATACAREFGPRAAERRVAIVLHAGNAIVDGDERRLRELARNLFDNALRHARATITIETGLERRDAFLRVTDDGEGIPAELRDRIFERFFHTETDGSGLGLPIAYWIASAHGGVLALSESSGGAAFTARLPAFEGHPLPDG